MKFIAIIALFALALAQRPVEGFRPPSVPLIVMDPYTRYDAPSPPDP